MAIARNHSTGCITSPARGRKGLLTVQHKFRCSVIFLPTSREYYNSIASSNFQYVTVRTCPFTCNNDFALRAFLLLSCCFIETRAYD